MGILWFLIIGLLAGWLAGKIMKGRGFGMIGNLIVGVVGSYMGGFLFRMAGLSAHGLIGSLIAATVGAIVLVWLVGVIKK